VNGSDDAFRAFVHGLVAVAVRLEKFRSGFADLIGLSGVQYTILISISHLQTDRSVSVKQVADYLSLSGAFVTTETGRLLKKGLIRKEPDGTDQRRVRLTVTDEGMARLEALAPVQREVNDVLFGCLSAEQFRELRAVVPKIVLSAGHALRLLRYHAAHGRLVDE
jgi:DNA-binding MarR family transcriptional regulator